MTRGDEDLLTITFPKNKIEPVVLAVVHKLAKKQVQQAAPNLATYARLRESDRVCWPNCQSLRSVAYQRSAVVNRGHGADARARA